MATEVAWTGSAAGTAGLREDAAAIAGDIAELRHAIHRDPEIGLILPRTQAKVLAALDGLALEVSPGQSVSSVTAVLRGGKPGKTVLLRGDMDALPLTETTGVGYASQVDGAMHACGHDLHTAMLAGAARLLSGRHAAEPHHALDPIPVACEIVTSLQTMVTRHFDVFDPVVITVASIHSGTTSNVIPDDAQFLASVRTFSPQARDKVRVSVQRLARDVAAAHGLTAEVEYVDGYPATVNDGTETAFAEQTIAAVLGAERFVAAPDPQTLAEDFSFVLQQVPGAFVMLGACPPGLDSASAPYNHSPEAVFDDGVLADGTAIYAELALRRLAAG